MSLYEVIKERLNADIPSASDRIINEMREQYHLSIIYIPNWLMPSTTHVPGGRSYLSPAGYKRCLTVPKSQPVLAA